MAKISLPNHSFILLALLLAAAFSADAALGGGGRTGLVGGIKEIKNVKENAYVQSLGKFSVDEENKSSGKQPSAKEGPLKFIEVFKAEQQVVAGMKYFLHINASLPTGGEGTFDAAVVVPPGMKSKQLLTFKRVVGGK
ncbi:unnamed protein product [Cuscuta epithymum]|uniref:Cystatin domain-containing protein n=1 Tax=Cuscuta epithymum TaxID=186058 RepID=A0AAV0E989_9ASTE|nr:unnamed protein product [Cuscuta epithymum]